MKEYYHMAEGQKNGIKEKSSVFLRGRKEISFAYIFGSFLEPAGISFRDIDIGVYLDPLEISQSQVFDYECDLAIQLSKIVNFPEDHIDVRVLNNAPSHFFNNVIKNGELLFSKNEGFFTDILEETSLDAIANESISMLSLKELIPS